MIFYLRSHSNATIVVTYMERPPGCTIALLRPACTPVHCLI